MFNTIKSKSQNIITSVYTPNIQMNKPVNYIYGSYNAEGATIEPLKNILSNPDNFNAKNTEITNSGEVKETYIFPLLVIGAMGILYYAIKR